MDEKVLTQNYRQRKVERLSGTIYPLPGRYRFQFPAFQTHRFTSQILTFDLLNINKYSYVTAITKKVSPSVDKLKQFVISLSLILFMAVAQNGPLQLSADELTCSISIKFTRK